ASSINSIMYKTTNGGNTWFPTECINASPSYRIYFINNNTGFAVGNSGQIIKTTTGSGAPIGINPVFSEIPKSFSLYQNYPNPFNPSTRIRFEISVETHSNASLRVYDILGREVTTLVSEQLKPGTYEIEWNASGNPSGVYFYKFQVGVYSTTKKMVLVK